MGPQSQFIFTLVVDVLNRMLRNSELEGLVDGWVVGKDEVKVYHLQFADNTIFFFYKDVCSRFKNV